MRYNRGGDGRSRKVNKGGDEKVEVIKECAIT